MSLIEFEDDLNGNKRDASVECGSRAVGNYFGQTVVNNHVNAAVNSQGLSNCVESEEHAYFDSSEMNRIDMDMTTVDHNMNSAANANMEHTSLILPQLRNQHDTNQTKFNEEGRPNNDKPLTIQNGYSKQIFSCISESLPNANASPTSLSSFALYEELRRSLKEAEKLKQNNQRSKQRKIDLQSEVVEASKTISRYEARTDVSEKRELDLRNELITAIRKARQGEHELEKCKRKIILMEKLYVESEKRNSNIEKKFTIERENCLNLEMKISNLSQNEETLQKDLDKKKAIFISGKAEYLELENKLETKDKELRNMKKEYEEYYNNKSVLNSQLENLISEHKEYKQLVDSLKLQQNEANDLNEKLICQIKQQKGVIVKISEEKRDLERRLEELVTGDKTRKNEKFQYQQQVREIQVRLEKVKHDLRNEKTEKDAIKAKSKSMKDEIEKLRNAFHDRLQKAMLTDRYMQNESEHSLRASLQHAEREKSLLTSKLQEKERLHSQMQSKIEVGSEEDSKHHILLHLEEQIKMLQHKTSFLEKENHSLQRQVEARNKQVSNDTLREEYDFRKKIKELEGENIMLRQERERREHSEDANVGDFSSLKEQHEKISIEMALTRNNMKKLEADNTYLRQQILQLKANIALGGDSLQHEGRVIPGKYKRGNFEIVSTPSGKKLQEQKRERGNTMRAFKATEGAFGKPLSVLDRARSLTDLSKEVSKHEQLTSNGAFQNPSSSDKEMEIVMPKHTQYSSLGELPQKTIESFKANGHQLVHTAKGIEQTSRATNPFLSLTKEELNYGYFEPKRIPITQANKEHQTSFSFNPLLSVQTTAAYQSRSYVQPSESSILGYSRSAQNETPGRSFAAEYKNEEKMLDFGNTNTLSSQASSGFGFQVPGALRSSPAAKTFASFVFNPKEDQHDAKSVFFEDRMPENLSETDATRSYVIYSDAQHEGDPLVKKSLSKQESYSSQVRYGKTEISNEDTMEEMEDNL